MERLCDTCRQHGAVEHFIDADHSSGIRTQRHMCIECFSLHPMADVHLVEIEERILKNGRCEWCGSPAFAISGMPGPRRHVYCEKCQEDDLIQTKC